jgi:uncharacterized protein YegP (UPF0339 family)
MEISGLRERLSAALLEFAWDEWSQMGVLAAAPRPRDWAEDPEALLLLSFEVARDDPRLFDEVLDWLVHNESLVSARRMRTLCENPLDSRLSSAAMDWVMRQVRPKSAGRGAAPVEEHPEPLFRGSGGRALPVLRPDPVFLAHGLLRSPAEPTHKSSDPDPRAPINFAFRLRHLLGVGTRAEAVRYLLTADIDSATVADVAASSGYAKRNIQEALSSLHAAGGVSVATVGGEQRFAVDRSRWSFLLGLDVKELPRYRNWPDLFAALRQILRWLMRPDLESLSVYLRASQAADLLDQVGPRLGRAGISLPARRGGERTWSDLEDTVDTAQAWLALPQSSVAPARFEVIEDDAGRFGWRLTGNDGRIAARSADSYASPAAVRAAVKRLQSAPETFSITVIGDSGAFRWNVVAENGRVLGASGELFATPGDAERAGRTARELVLGAVPPSEAPAEIVGQARRHVFRQPDGRWRVEVEGATHAASTHRTQSDAIRAARRSASEGAGDSVVIVHGRDGRVRSSDLVAGRR